MGKAGKQHPIDVTRLDRQIHAANRGQGSNVFTHPMKGTDFKFGPNAFLRRTGGIMDGPIGFTDDTFSISTGALDITGADTITARGIVRVQPESGTTDTLDHIDAGGKEMRGQLLILLSDAGDTITISDDTAGTGDEREILCPNGNDFTLTGPNAIWLVYDNSVSKWIIIGESGGTANTISEGNSDATITDTGTGLFAVTIDGSPIFNVSGAETQVNTAYDIDMNTHDIVDLGDIGFNSGTLDGITTSLGQIIHDIDSGGQHDFRVNSSTLLNIQTAQLLISTDIEMQDENGIRSESGFTYFMTGSTAPTTMSAAANVGALGIPYKEDTTDSPSASTLNDWFGDQNGCIGLQFDDDTPDVFKLWCKLNGTWHFKDIDDT